MRPAPGWNWAYSERSGSELSMVWGEMTQNNQMLLLGILSHSELFCPLLYSCNKMMGGQIKGVEGKQKMMSSDQLKNEGDSETELKQVIFRKKPSLSRGEVKKMWNWVAKNGLVFSNAKFSWNPSSRKQAMLSSTLRIMGSLCPSGPLWHKGKDNTCIFTFPALGWEWWLWRRQGNMLLCVSF